jgi:predicted 2-oxoglutarate/Fe(II)-dependent dioxygenase YbiX
MSGSATDFTATCVVCENVFTPAELDSIERYGDGLDRQQATLAGEGWARDDAQQRIRITRTAAMTFGPEIKWLYDRMQAIIRKVNRQVYQFELEGFREAFQYTVYHGAEGGHYDWHIDWGPIRVQRKLSASVQLSDPGQYEGCDLQFHGARQVETAPRERGAVIVFPSFIQHRVTPCTKGTRKAIVAWTTGPRFK